MRQPSIILPDERLKECGVLFLDNIKLAGGRQLLQTKLAN
jgi:hypothetical protein